MSMNIVRVCGAEIESVWKDLAELRIQVFREFPYLYEGTFDYEREYLATYWKSLPLLDEQAEFRAPFADPEQYFYLGESVLLPQYRGQGLGATFFDERERYARRLGFSKACFCAVERTEEPPVGYRPLHEFWTKRGYQRRDDLRTEFSWTDVGANAETAKPMVFWVRDPL
jgi:GNAT superfamily N-acetyltransferase